MPSKKATKPTSRSSPRRERSKSVGRSKTKSRSPSRSRSRSRVNTTKRSRTPASESKVRRRRSPSSSSSASSSPKRRDIVQKLTTRPVPDASGDKHVRTTMVQRESTPSRFSQRIIEKIETSRPLTAVQERRKSPHPSNRITGWSAKLRKVGEFFRETVCPSPFIAALGILILIPLPYWFSLGIFAPATAFQPANTEASKTAVNDRQTTWGPGRPFAGVLWPTDWHVYLNPGCYGFAVAYLLSQFIITRFVPIGYRVSSSPESRRQDYRCNGFFALVFYLCLFAVAQWSTLPQLKHLKPSLLLPKYLLGLITAFESITIPLVLLAYFLSRHAPRSQINPEGNTGNFIVDFCNGRVVRPRWLGVDWKMFILRPTLMGILLIDFCYVCAQWERFGRVNPGLMALAAMHIVYISDFFIFEHSHLFSYNARYEGFGFYSILGLAISPFVFTVGSAYLFTRAADAPLSWDTKADVCRCALFGFATIMFLVGYWIYRASLNQKALFRRQPNHPTFADMDKITGPYTQRLLAGGWWGFVRHPNYLGDLMMSFAMALPIGLQCIIPWLNPLILAAYMMHRVWLTEHAAEQRYGLSMTMYQKMVPHRLIPKVF